MFADRILGSFADGMGDYVANQTIKCMNRKGVLVKDSNILILGITFKENCPDIRNTKVVDIYQTMKEYTSNISIYDPWADVSRVQQEYGINILNEDLSTLKGRYDVVILAVAHNQFKDIDIREFLKDSSRGVVYDVKGILSRDMIDARL